MNFNIDLAMDVIKSSSDFPIDFNEAWQWLEFSNYSNGLRSFVNCDFSESIDFAVFIIKEKDVTKFGGYKKVTRYYLTVDCFKTWAMMVNTAKGKEVRKYFIECEKKLKSIIETTKPLTAIAHYSNRVHILKETLVKDTPNTWCVIEKCSHLLLEVEKQGYVINEHDLLDGSVGIQWSNYRKGKEWALPTSTATYDFRNQRGKRVITAYQYSELGYFGQWLETIYEIKSLPLYLKGKEIHGALIKV